MAVYLKNNEWCIDYRDARGKRYREKIGPNKRQAINVLHKRKVEIAEGKFFDRQKPITTIFDELAHAYLAYAQHNKRSWMRDRDSIKKLVVTFGGTRIVEITPADIEQYKTIRRAAHDMHSRYPKPATVNRELACLKHMFNVAMKGLLHLPGGASIENPVSHVKRLYEDNIRDRVFTIDEFQRMLRCAPDYFKPILECAYYTAMRKGEILGLTWDKVDLHAGFIRLSQSDTKTSQRRDIPIGRELAATLKALFAAFASRRRDQNVISISRSDHVFTHNGKPVKSINRVFAKVCQKAGITDCVFHDFRHTAITNFRRAGVNDLTIMKITGHKTYAVYKRYNTIDDTDLTDAANKMNTYDAALRQQAVELRIADAMKRDGHYLDTTATPCDDNIDQAIES